MDSDFSHRFIKFPFSIFRISAIETDSTTNQEFHNLITAAVGGTNVLCGVGISSKVSPERQVSLEEEPLLKKYMFLNPYVAELLGYPSTRNNPKKEPGHCTYPNRLGK